MCANHLPARVAAVTPGAPTPDNEGERLVALGELELADHKCPALTSLCTLLTSLFDMPLVGALTVASCSPSAAKYLCASRLYA